jgi:hypothetical protein
LFWIAGPDNVERVARLPGDVGVTRIEVVTGEISTSAERPTTSEERSLVDDTC